MGRPVIRIAADHRGYALKAEIIGWLEGNGHLVSDLGTHDAQRCDALDYAKALAAELASDSSRLGILICGSGQAMAMAANR